MSTKSDKAKQLFKGGANCAQAVLGAFAEECGLEPDQAMRMASSFGAGMGRLREVCGAVSGMLLVLGLQEGDFPVKDKQGKDRHYARVQALASAFKGETGSIICRELLGLEKKGPDTPISEARTDAYYRRRPCMELVGLAAQILETHLTQTNTKGEPDHEERHS
jgi:C_GCAxxG_C_C family probable redox protein